jgi:hypothetical protein
VSRRRLAGRRYVATGTAAAAVSIIVTTSPGWDTIALGHVLVTLLVAERVIRLGRLPQPADAVEQLHRASLDEIDA